MIDDKGNIDVDIRSRLTGDGFEQGAAKLADLRKEAAVAADGFSGLSTAAQAAVVTMGGLSVAVVAASAAWVAYEGAQIAAAFAIKDTADETGKLAQRMGMEIAQVSELQYTMSLANISAAEFGGMVKFLANKMQEAAAGNQRAIALFDSLKISITGAGDRLKTVPQMLDEIADRFSTYHDGLEKTALANDLLGRSGEKFIPVMNGGAVAMREAAKEAHQLGVIYGADLVKASANLNDNLARLKAAAEGAKIALGGPMVKTLSDVTDWMVKARKEGNLLTSVLMGIGALTVKLLGGEINPMELASGAANDAFKKYAEAKKALDLWEAAQKNGHYVDDTRLAKAREDVERYRKALDVAISRRDKLLPKEGPAPTNAAPVPPKPERTGRATTDRPLANGLSDSKARQQMNWELDALGVADHASRKWKEQEEAARRAMAVVPEAQRKMAEEMAKIDRTVATETDRLNKMREQGHIDAGVYATSLAKLTTEAANHKAVMSGMAAQQEELNRSWEYGATRALRSYMDEIQNTARQSERLMDGMLRQAEDVFVNIGKSGRFEIGSLTEFIRGEMARTLYRQTLAPAVAGFTKGISSSIADAFGLGSGNTGSINWSSYVTPTWHTGGVPGVDSSAESRSVPAHVFHGAPRYHTGGIAGNEVPAILQRGEGVFTKGQMAALGGAGGVSVQVIDQRSAASSAPVSVEQGQGADGRRQIRVLIRDEVRNAVGGGYIDKQMRESYGVGRLVTDRG